MFIKSTATEPRLQNVQKPNSVVYKMNRYQTCLQKKRNQTFLSTKSTEKKRVYKKYSNHTRLQKRTATELVYKMYSNQTCLKMYSN